jgi:hypothetical protein
MGCGEVESMSCLPLPHAVLCFTSGLISPDLHRRVSVAPHSQPEAEELFYGGQEKEEKKRSF